MSLLASLAADLARAVEDPARSVCDGVSALATPKDLLVLEEIGKRAATAAELTAWSPWSPTATITRLRTLESRGLVYRNKVRPAQYFLSDAGREKVSSAAEYAAEQKE